MEERGKLEALHQEKCSDDSAAQRLGGWCSEWQWPGEGDAVACAVSLTRSSSSRMYTFDEEK